MRDAGETQEIRLAEVLSALCHALDMTEGQPEGHCIRCCWIGVQRRPGDRPRRAPDLGTLLHAAAQGPRLQQQCRAHLPALPDRRSHLQARLQAHRRQPAAGPALRAVPHRPEGRPRRALPRHHQHLPERRRDRARADRDALPPRRRHRPQDALSGSRRARHPEPRRALGRRRQAHRRAQARTSRSTPRSHCWRRSSTCSTPAAAAMRRGARSSTAPAPGSTPRWSMAFERVAARSDFWDMLRSPEPARRHLRAGTRAARHCRGRRLSRRHRRRLRPGDRLQEPLHQRPQRARDAVHRHDRRRAGLRAGAPPLAQARGAAARHRQARRQQHHPRQARQARRRRMGGDEDARRLLRSHPVAHRRLQGSRRNRRCAPRAARRQGLSARPEGRPDRLETRIISTADVFDALTADRPYRAAMPVSKALAIMAEGLGTATDPAAFNALRRAIQRVDPALAA